MPLPPALVASVHRIWLTGFILEFAIPVNPPVSFNVYIDGVLFRNYPQGQFQNNVADSVTRIFVTGFRLNPASASVSAQVSYVINGQESILSVAVVVNTRRVEAVASPQQAEEIAFFTN